MQKLNVHQNRPAAGAADSGAAGPRKGLATPDWRRRQTVGCDSRTFYAMLEEVQWQCDLRAARRHHVDQMREHIADTDLLDAMHDRERQRDFALLDWFRLESLIIERRAANLAARPRRQRFAAALAVLRKAQLRCDEARRAFARAAEDWGAGPGTPAARRLFDAVIGRDNAERAFRGLPARDPQEVWSEFANAL